MAEFELTHYQAYFCEENVWWMLQHPALATRECAAVVVANEAGGTLLWEQRVAPPGVPVMWDYHVVAVAGVGAAAEIIDADTRLGLVTPAARWLRATFWHAFEGSQSRDILQTLPRFRIVNAANFLRTFATDRSHMRGDDGGWINPPPPWTAPRTLDQTMTLPRFLDLADDIAGEVVSLSEMLDRFA